MRQLFPTSKEKAGVLNPTKGNFVLTEDDYKSILESLQILQDRQSEDENELEDYKQQLIEAITSGIANFTTLTANEASIREAVIDSLSSTNISSESLTVDTLNALISATIERLTVSGLLQASEISTPQATIQNLESGTIEADSIEVENLSVSGNYEIENLDSTNANIENLDATTITSDAANIDNLTADSLTGTEATIEEVSTSELTAAETYSEKIYSHYINHNQIYNKQFIDTTSVGPDGDYYIVLPKFRNGTYYLIAENEASGLYLWSMEVTNSIKNVTFSWSTNSGEAYLQDVEVIEDSTDETQFIQIHCKLNTQAINLYHRCDDLNTQTPPSIYNSKQFDGTQQFEITQQKGNYMPNAVFVGEFHAEHLIIEDIQFDKVTVLKQIELASGYDAYGEPLGTTTGLPNQYIKNIEVNGQIRTQWTSPATEVERDNENLITSDAVSEYDGQVDLGEDPLDPTQHIYDYPITHLGDNTVVHGDAEIEGELKTPNLQVSGETSSELDIDSGIFIGNGPAYTTVLLVKAVLDGVTTWYEINNNKQGYAYLTEVDTSDYFDITSKSTAVAPFGPWATCYYNNMSNLLMNMKPWTFGEPEDPIQLFASFYTVSNEGFSRKAPKLEDVEASLLNITQIADNGDFGINSEIGLYDAKKAKESGGFNNYRIKQLEGGIKADPLLAENGDVELEHGKPLIYNKPRAAVETTDELEIDKLTADDLITDEVYTRDLHVTGHAYINDTVEEEVDGNYLTLRANNASAMTTNETSGILINNTDGDGNIVALVSDKDGTARVGDVTGTRTTYPSLYLKDNKYYTDASYQTEVTPQGSMVSWDSKEELADGAIYWTNAVFVVISATLTDLQPLMTRKEDVDMNDKGILIYDKTSHRSETIALPVKDEQTLEAHVVEEAGETTISYRWKDKQAGSYVYATMTDYEADAANVPVGSQIIIEDEMNYLTGDDQ